MTTPKRGRPRHLPRCGALDPRDADLVCDEPEDHSGRHVAADGSDWEPETIGHPTRDRWLQIRVTDAEQTRWHRVAVEMRRSVSEVVRSQLERLERETGLE